jgi:periplasmic protein TonB
MFSELVESSPVGRITHKRWAVVLSAMGQVILLSLLILIPLIHTQALPKALSSTYLLAPQPPALQSQFPKPARTRRAPRLFNGIRLIAPTSIPPKVEVLREPELPPDAESSPQVTSVFNDIPRLGMTGGNVGPNPAVPSPLKADQPARLNRGGDVEQALLISQSKPAYPLLAIQTHTQGDVVLRAIISKDGNVAELQLVSGHPLLVKAAMEAVRQWRYKPTLLNGEPVEVDTTITVTFRLGG